MNILLALLRVLLPIGTLLAIGYAAYSARQAIYEGLLPNRYEFIVGLLVETAGLAVELILIVLFLDYFAKSAQRRLTKTASDLLPQQYNSLSYPLLQSLTEILEMRKTWERIETHRAACEDPQPDAELDRQLLLKVEELDARLDSLIDTYNDAVTAIGARLPELTTRFSAMLSADDAVIMLRLSHELESAKPMTLEDKPFGLKVPGSTKFKTAYAVALSHAATFAFPSLDFDDRFGREFSSRVIRRRESGALYDLQRQDFPASRLCRARTPDRRTDMSNLAIETCYAEGFLNEMAWWIAFMEGRTAVVAHGMQGSRFGDTLRKRARQNRRLFRWHRLLSLASRKGGRTMASGPPVLQPR